ncbi:hypothetical protein BDF21DRAFT_53358 [Thamnidium elegans]|nr:hypothetical protein BDF21DRAFT_53358 [Thamnidium elegans]
MPPKRKQMEGGKLEDVMDAIKTTIEDAIKDSISTEIVPILTRLDDIDRNISELSEKIDNFNLMNHNSVIIDEANIIPILESDGRSKEKKEINARCFTKGCKIGMSVFWSGSRERCTRSWACEYIVE